MGQYFEPMMSMLLAASLGAIAAVATIRFNVTDKSFGVLAVLLWLYLMKDFYDWGPDYGFMILAGPIGLIALGVQEILYLAHLLCGILVLAIGFSKTRRFVAYHAGSGTL